MTYVIVLVTGHEELGHVDRQDVGEQLLVVGLHRYTLHVLGKVHVVLIHTGSLWDPLFKNSGANVECTLSTCVKKYRAHVEHTQQAHVEHM